MNCNFIVPAMISKKEILSTKCLALWKAAVYTVKQAQQKFIDAYKQTLHESCPEWETRWQTDPLFQTRLAEVEDNMKDVCRANGMDLTVFNRYRTAARKHVLMKVPFKMASTNFTISELREIKEDPEKAKELRHQKNVKHAAKQVAKHATIIPLPDAFDNDEDYLAAVQSRLTEHLSVAKSKLGPEAYKKLIALITLEIEGHPLS